MGIILCIAEDVKGYVRGLGGWLSRGNEQVNVEAGCMVLEFLRLIILNLEHEADYGGQASLFPGLRPLPLAVYKIMNIAWERGYGEARVENSN